MRRVFRAVSATAIGSAHPELVEGSEPELHSLDLPAQMVRQAHHEREESQCCERINCEHASEIL